MVKRKKLTIILLTLVSFFFTTCQSERYRKDRKNKLSKHTIKASDYLAKQAIALTQENIENRENTEKKDRKRQEKLQKELNEANKRTSKVAPVKKHKGNFKFY
ncbi:MAG: hypothetical protein J7604_02690 [Sporocytophaga sp.]|uniref:hypothetical protein n=1 Tax=Sporocytophaga sp. TaxID=2231183 RepID=UPI001B2753C6|nr:hypothetical protein [Sporocytophaga sp.]MBO9699086.1 hypothetical protein [Sporocytophaga sp.]